MGKQWKPQKKSLGNENRNGEEVSRIIGTDLPFLHST
jgi:hypothetical protein